MYLIKTLVVLKLWIKLEAAQATPCPQLKFGEAVPTSNYIELHRTSLRSSFLLPARMSFRFYWRFRQ
jgi:hypothetical protein